MLDVMLVIVQRVKENDKKSEKSRGM